MTISSNAGKRLKSPLKKGVPYFLNCSQTSQLPHIYRSWLLPVKNRIRQPRTKIHRQLCFLQFFSGLLLSIFSSPQFQSIRHSHPVRMARTMEYLHYIFCLLRNYNGLDCIRLSLLSNCCCQQPGYSTRHSASVQRNYYLGKIL